MGLSNTNSSYSIVRGCMTTNNLFLIVLELQSNPKDEDLIKRLYSEVDSRVNRGLMDIGTARKLKNRFKLGENR